MKRNFSGSTVKAFIAGIKGRWRSAVMPIFLLTPLLGAPASAQTAAAPRNAGSERSYVVLYKSLSVPPNAEAKIKTAGGRLTYAYGPIGVVIARSGSDSFIAGMLADNQVEGISATEGFAIQGGGQIFEAKESAAPTPAVPAPTGLSEPLAGLQWDMEQIKAPQARDLLKGGSPSIVVADLDTGIDYRHPDLAPNIDFSRSASCIGGVPNQDPAAWDDDLGHGTHTAGTIAAAANGLGIAGVAPNVKLAAIKVGNSDNLFFPEAVICGFVWAAEHGARVANNSYFVDPWLYNCRNDAGQRAIWRAIQRSVRYAISKGVVVVTSAGNEFTNVAHPTVDSSSPDFPPDQASERDVNNACAIVPAEVPGVITVGSTGNLLQKALYSNYGLGYIDVAAPGGDSFFQLTPAAPNGQVLSTWPAKFDGVSRIVKDCSVSPCAVYRYLQGTSMAAPHVTGIAALILSRDPKLSVGAVAAKLAKTADALPCPGNPFLAGTPFEATCAGGTGQNSFYGSGQVNALGAVQ